MNNYSMSNGILTIPNSHGPVTWAVPGANIAWSGRYVFEGPVIQVMDVTQDSTNTYVYTSLTGGFPNLQLGGITNFGMRTHPAPKFTCTNCTGSADAVDLSGAPAGAPLWSYSKRTYTGSTAPGLVPIWGKMTNITITPTVAYTGSSAINFNIDGPFVGLLNSTIVPLWNPSINPARAAERDISPTSISVAQLGDNLSAPGADTWFFNNQITPKFSSVPADIGATSVTITIKTDQGVVTQ